MPSCAIAVVSSGRSDTIFERAMTPSFFGNLPWFLYVPAAEASSYKEAADEAIAHGLTGANLDVRCIPDHLDYHQSLDYVTKHLYMAGNDAAALFDDDRVMTYWANQRVHKAGRATPKDFERSLNEMLSVLSPGVPLIGCRLRGFCWKDDTPFTLAGKCVGMQLLHLPTMATKFQFSWGARSMHDHHLLAQVLSSGYLALTYNKLLHDDRFGHMAPSGCGRWRTAKMHSEAAHLMEREFPVAVRTRLKGWVKGQELYDIVFSSAKLLYLDLHIKLFGTKYLNQIRPFLNEKQQDMIDVAIQDYSVQ